MPSNWLSIDTNFPSFTGGESPNDKIGVIQNYLFMLVEQLRYTLRNLDISNMNAVKLEEYTGSITDPINAAIQDADGHITQLQAAADGLALQVASVEGNVTALAATAKGIETRIASAEGAVSSLKQTVDGFQLTATDDGNSTTLTLTSTGISVSTTIGSISAAEGAADAALSRAASAQAMVKQIADGKYEGTFISGTTIYSPSIYAGSADKPGGQIVGIDSDGIRVYAGDGDPLLQIHQCVNLHGGVEAWMESYYNNLRIVSRDELGLSAPRVCLGDTRVFFGEKAEVDFEGAKVKNLTVYFS